MPPIIVLGGDLHDSFASQMYRGGAFEGEPVAVNLGITGVTSPGWGPPMSLVLSPLIPILGSSRAVLELVNDLFEGQNPGMVYTEVGYKGFFAVKATKVSTIDCRWDCFRVDDCVIGHSHLPTSFVTKESHITEYFNILPEDILRNYTEARAVSGNITSSYFCGTSLVTTAGQKGSLVEQDKCSAIEFETTRSELFEIPVPTNGPAASSTELTDCGVMGCELEVNFDEPSGVDWNNTSPNGNASDIFNNFTRMTSGAATIVSRFSTVLVAAVALLATWCSV